MAKLYHLPTGPEAPDLVDVVIEVPMGSPNKYEYAPGLEGKQTRIAGWRGLEGAHELIRLGLAAFKRLTRKLTMLNQN